jgi:predicted metalloendopeptidase
MVWRTLKEVVPLLDRRFRKTYYKFKEKIQGSATVKPRRKICFSYTDNILGPILGSLFVRKAFSPESKAKVGSCFLFEGELTMYFAEMTQMRVYNFGFVAGKE